jgi:hydrogenase maturation protein HypF
MATPVNPTLERWRILVQGMVQGVGFRPFVYGLAVKLALGGFVYNDSAGVTIEVEGEPMALDAFKEALTTTIPPLAQINSLCIESLLPVGSASFVISHSLSTSQRLTLIAPDSATCDDCLGELFNPADRRFGYPFINCTNCGPRFTIVKDVPYDRDKTTMAGFTMCPSCQVEYDNPLDRRFHAQPNACPVCGPQLSLLDAGGLPITTDCPVEEAARQLARGTILSIKGLGGYHLACNALSTEAVSRLRRSKHREAKPFALMVADLATARQLCQVSEAEADLLQSRQRPVVLLDQKRLPTSPLASAVAPGYPTLGVMLPYTPLHHLLLKAVAEINGPKKPAVLVMTSGNLSDEPIAYADSDALTRLANIAEGWLTHDRPIHMRCDDPVVRALAGGTQFIRRSRGYAPAPINLSFEFPVPLLACGGHLKNTFCLGKSQQAFVSHHIGDLENLETLGSYRAGIEHFERLFDITPQAVAYDLHPDYLATRYALELDVPYKIGVQHHHAHIASVMAEHGLTGPVIGLAADGTGYGPDGTIWGCEIMTASLADFERAGHLAYVPLPGGEMAVKQPWRMAAVYLSQVYGDSFLDLEIPFVRGLDQAKWKPLPRMIANGINSPRCSSLGRLFDGMAALLGVRSEAVYEAQAAIELEALAETETSLENKKDAYPFTIRPGQPFILDVFPLIEAIVMDLQRGVPVPRIARRFHLTVSELLVAACLQVKADTGLTTVALSGGVFQNRRLTRRLVERLEECGFQTYLNRQIPPNDGGLSLGQAAVAAARLRQ